MDALNAVMKLLIYQQPLPERCYDHKLKGKYAEYRECHVKPDWILIYRLDYSQNLIVFEYTGTHSDLFKN